MNRLLFRTPLVYDFNYFNPCSSSPLISFGLSNSPSLSFRRLRSSLYVNTKKTRLFSFKKSSLKFKKRKRAQSVTQVKSI